MYSFSFRLKEQLQKLSARGTRREMLSVQPTGSACLRYRDRAYLNLAGNDYLGLAGNPDLLEKFYAELGQKDIIEQYGPGSGASRLMTGNHEQYSCLEEQLASSYQKEKALVFTSGYHINIGLLPALARKGDLILADKLCHASLIDGMRLSEARMIRYPHLDYDRLEHILQKHCTGSRNRQKQSVFLVTESIFSMDGDCADLPTLVYLKEKYRAVLYVDEAHSVGVRGQQGLGSAEEQNVIDRIDLLVGTFGKAWGGLGAFLLCDETIYNYLLNTSRSLIFTTALPPVNIHWLNFVLPVIQKMKEKREKLAELSRKLRTALLEAGLRTGGESHIVPVMIGEEEKAVRVAELLRQQGFWVQAVRTPAVPRGTARLRLSLTAALQEEQLAPLPEHIVQALSA